jgi:hypothetical protein
MVDFRCSRRGWPWVILAGLSGLGAVPWIGVAPVRDATGPNRVPQRDKSCHDPTRKVTTFVYDSSRKVVSIREEPRKRRLRRRRAVRSVRYEP